MKFFQRLLTVALPLLLAACVPQTVRMKGDAALLGQQQAREHQLADANHWTLQGQLGVSDGRGNGGNGSLTWTQDGDRYDFVVRAPITGKSLVHLSGGPEGALLEGTEGAPLRGADAEELMQRAMGWTVPLRDLRAWVLGLRADSGPAELSFGVNRLPSLLQQDGWTVDYRKWDEAHQPPLPKVVFAGKSPYSVRLSIQSWHFN